MKKIFNFIIIFIFLVIVAFSLLPLFLEKNISFSLTHSYESPVSEVFQEFNEVQSFGSNLHWLKKDSVNTRLNFFAPYKGKGSSFTWENKVNKEIGSGEYKIINSVINKRITALLSFNQSKITNYCSFSFEKEGNQTLVTLNFKTSDFSYLGRITGYFMQKDIEQELNDCLAAIDKTLSKNKKIIKTIKIGEVAYSEFNGNRILSIENETDTSPENMFKAINKSLSAINKFLIDSLNYSSSDIKNPIVYYQKYDTVSKFAKFYAGYPIKNNFVPNGSMQWFNLPSGTTIYTPIKGNYPHSFQSKYLLDKFAKENGIGLGGFWFEYENEFNDKPDFEFQGKVVYKMKN